MVDLVLGMAKRVSTPSMASKRRVVIGICAVLAAITWLVFGQTLRHKFVTFDDPQYVYENAKVTAGLSLEGVSWAFTHTIADNSGTRPASGLTADNRKTALNASCCSDLIDR
jgi:hypothetical protein